MTSKPSQDKEMPAPGIRNNQATKPNKAIKGFLARHVATNQHITSRHQAAISPDYEVSKAMKPR